MANLRCINGTVDGSTFSSPVPFIGLYIALASLACMLLMLGDIVAGFRAKKRWLPCHLFKLNSVSLTLLAIATKLPVDLTTSMPSAQDQLSKLSGTTFICVCMGFLMPSFGNNSEADIFSNLMALSIFVITVVVNICIQIHTGVIVVFIAEHIIVLCLMVLLLLMFWRIYPSTKERKSITTSCFNMLVRKGNNSMFGRLKVSYLYAYCCDPQFTVTINPNYAGVGTISPLCLAILMQASIRSLILKQVNYRCSGMSDYDWSMPIIVVTQILTVIVGTLPIVFRWLSLFRRMEFEMEVLNFFDDEEAILRKRTLEKGVIFHRLYKFACIRILRIVFLLIATPTLLVRHFLGFQIRDSPEHFVALPHEGFIEASEYIARKSVDDIIRFREVCISEPLTNLLQLFSRQSPSPSRYFDGMKIIFRDNVINYPRRIDVCSLSMALLVKTAQVCLPGNLVGSLVHAFREGQEIIHFIEQTVIPATNETQKSDFSYAKDLWRYGDFSGLLPGEYSQRQSGLYLDLNSALEIISKLWDTWNLGHADSIGSQLGIIKDFILGQNPSTLEDLYTTIEQLFVEMLHVCFSKLPVAIFKYLSESPTEEFQERVRLAIKFVFQVESLDGIVIWSLPQGSGISEFIKDEAFASTVFTGPLARLAQLKEIVQRTGETGV